MDIVRPEESVYYIIEANDQTIEDTCLRLNIARDSEEFINALAAVLIVDDADPKEPPSIGHILEVEALLEIYAHMY